MYMTVILTDKEGEDLEEDGMVWLGYVLENVIWEWIKQEYLCV